MTNTPTPQRNSTEEILEKVRELISLEKNCDMPPQIEGETDAQYTDRLSGADGTGRKPYKERRLRQCSIGWHDECSDPRGEKCECPCHKIDKKWMNTGYEIAMLCQNLWEENKRLREAANNMVNIPKRHGIAGIAEYERRMIALRKALSNPLPPTT